MSKPRKSIFITGAAAGIGRATAIRFAAAGWRVGLYDIDLLGVKALASAIGPQAVVGKLDVTNDVAFAKALADFAEPTDGRIDVLFNNAGILSTGDFESMPLARCHALIDINTKGVVNGCHAALPYLRIAKGRVINMASASAIYGTPAFAVYSSTKFFVRGLTEALNIEWARLGIYVCDVMPLFVDTPMLKDVKEKPKSVKNLGVRLTADDIAAVVFEAATRAAWRSPVHWLPGRQTQALALMNKLVPQRLARASNKYLSGY
ncbi:MAG: SDR family oxidoreductase [Stagnimonas sp.]|nr:SDR family oxidoreductase [Stagnimonas sp.]